MRVTASAKPTLLSIPLELRLQIYEYLLVLPCHPRQLSRRRTLNDKIHPAILSVCTQTHDEAAPILYGNNTFLVHTSLLTALPRLRAWHAPVTLCSTHADIPVPSDLTTTNGRTPLRRIRRWWVRVRLDTDPAWDTAAVTRAFSGAESIALEAWSAIFMGAGVDSLRRFEGVRGVRRVRIFGSLTGYEGYARWLKRSMTAPVGAEVPEYVAADEREQRRLTGWSGSLLVFSGRRGKEDGPVEVPRAEVELKARLAEMEREVGIVRPELVPLPVQEVAEEKMLGVEGESASRGEGSGADGKSVSTGVSAPAAHGFARAFNEISAVFMG